MCINTVQQCTAIHCVFYNWSYFANYRNYTHSRVFPNGSKIICEKLALALI